jgi:hypothetical protein
MKIYFFDLIDELKKHWGKLTEKNDIMVADKYYWAPSYDSLQDLVWRTYIDRYKYIKDAYDCDDFALSLHAFVVQTRYEEIYKRKVPKEEWYPWAFGQIWGYKFRGVKGMHAINICLTSDRGLVLIEPQEDKIWRVNNEKDIASAIRF